MSSFHREEMSENRRVHNLRSHDSAQNWNSAETSSKRSFVNSSNYSDSKRQNVWSSNYENDDDSDQSLFDDEKEFHVQNSPSKDSMARTAESQPQKVELSEEEKKVRYLQQVIQKQKEQENKEKEAKASIKRLSKRRKVSRANRAAPSQAPETEVKAEPVVDEYNMNMMKLEQFKENKSNIVDRLHSIILSWNLDAVKLNLETLPIVFPDTDTYIRLFEQHILDEIRTQSLQQREKCYTFDATYQGYTVNKSNDSFTYIYVMINKNKVREEINNFFTEICLTRKTKQTLLMLFIRTWSLVREDCVELWERELTA